MSKPRNISKLMKAWEERPLDVLRVRIVNHSPEILAKVRKTGKNIYITAERIIK